jgi:hypothetical protein
VLCRIIRRRLLTLIAGFSPALLLMALTAGCSADHSALKRSPYSSAVIYAIPQSEALALVREATLAVETRYGVSDLAIVEYPARFSPCRLHPDRWHCGERPESNRLPL